MEVRVPAFPILGDEKVGPLPQLAVRVGFGGIDPCLARSTQVVLPCGIRICRGLDGPARMQR